jgi:glyoxylase-like metal-dependent hydrolase (beta-lactamase superfamily II)
MPPTQTHGVTTVDAHYMYPGRAATYLIVDSGEAAFIDAGTRYSVPHMLQALAEAGRAPGDVKYIIVTHVHLDHCGGAASLARACPNAQVLCHPRSERHLIDPTKLVASATPVYGVEKFAQLYGEIESIPAARVRAVNDGESVSLGQRSFGFLDTPGHAKHHVSVWDRTADTMFTGDAFGLSYPYLQRGTRPYFNYVCSPPQFEPEAARQVIRRIMATHVGRVCVTHFGPNDRVQEGGEQLLRMLDEFDAATNRAAATDLDGQRLLAYCADEALRITSGELRACGLDTADPEVMRWALSEHSVTSQGIQALALERRAGKAA